MNFTKNLCTYVIVVWLGVLVKLLTVEEGAVFDSFV